MPLDPFGQSYLTMTLEIAKHVDGYVDSYYGPPELKAAVEASPKKTPAALLADLSRLRDLLPTADPARHAYLVAVLRAMDCTLRMLSGEAVDYLDEVYRIYDIHVAGADEAQFEQARRALDAALPGSGDVAERMAGWRKQFDIPQDRLIHIFDITLAEARTRTKKLFDLADGESIEFRLTSNQPWSGYNWYQGGLKSLVEVNVDIPASALDVVPWATHEAYPGHHTEHHLKEKHLYQKQGHAECASALLHSPAAVISEGIATTAAEIVFPGDTHYAWTAEVILPEAGLPTASPELLKQISEARDVARLVSNNAAILYNTGKMTEEQTVDYIQSYALVSEKRARQSFSFISNPLFRSYPFTYTEGHALIAGASHGGDKTPVFRRLLTEEVLPSSLI